MRCNENGRGYFWVRCGASVREESWRRVEGILGMMTWLGFERERQSGDWRSQGGTAQFSCLVVRRRRMRSAMKMGAGPLHSLRRHCQGWELALSRGYSGNDGIVEV